MSRWTHSICELCWFNREPDREPARLNLPDQEDCCFCGSPTTSGIYVREDPTGLHCQKGLLHA